MRRRWPSRGTSYAREGHRSPYDVHPVLPEHAIARDDRHALRQCLRDEQPVERVMMMEWEMLDRGGVCALDRHQAESLVEPIREVSLDGKPEVDPFSGGLDRQFPDAGGADVQPCPI